jgi:hypothetical protein
MITADEVMATEITNVSINNWAGNSGIFGDEEAVVAVEEAVGIGVGVDFEVEVGVSVGAGVEV